MTIKKSFVELYAVLESNKDKKVSEIMHLLEDMMESKQRDITHRHTEHGLEVFCWYHKEWELVSQVEYGSKVNTKTGYNTMCKVGVNCWTKQQRDYKVNKGKLLDRLNSKELKVNQISEMLEELESEKDKIVPLKEYHHAEAIKEDAERFPKEETQD